MAREAAHALDLDGVLFVPAGQPSHRDPTRIAGTTGRCVGHMGEIRARFRLMNLLNCRKSERRRLAQPPEDREPASSELGLVELTAQVRPANLDDEVVQCRPEPVHTVADHDAELGRGLIQKLPEDDLIAARIELARAG